MAESEIHSINIVKNNELCITESEWAALNEQYNKAELTDLLSKTIAKLPFPYRKLTSVDALNSYNELRTLDARKLWKRSVIYMKYPVSHPLKDFYIEIHKGGSDASNYFHQSNRFECASVNSPSPLKIWTTEILRRNWLKVLWSMNYSEVNSAILRQALSLRGYVASQFRPSAAKAIYELLATRDTLDLSAGYGDRLAAFSSLERTRSYVGCDPNRHLLNGYESQIELYGKDKKFEMICSAAEDVDFGKHQFDTVFSSPPFFRSERYSTDGTQSWLRYRTLDTWLNGFLFKSLNTAWKALKPKGLLAINLADVYSEGKVNKIVDPMNSFLESECGGQFVSGVGYRILARPQRAKKNCVNVEGIWIWRKRA